MDTALHPYIYALVRSTEYGSFDDRTTCTYLRPSQGLHQNTCSRTDEQVESVGTRSNDQANDTMAVLITPLRCPSHWVSWKDRRDWIDVRAGICGAGADTDTVLEDCQRHWHDPISGNVRWMVIDNLRGLYSLRDRE